MLIIYLNLFLYLSSLCLRLIIYIPKTKYDSILRIANTGALSLIFTTFLFSAFLTSRFLILAELIPLVLLNGFTIERLYSRLLSRKFCKFDYFLVILNSFPYLFFFTFYLIIPLLFIILAFITSYLKIKIVPTLFGTYSIASLYLPWTAILYEVNIKVFSIFVLWFFYTLTQSLYVEYKIPFRKISKNIVRLAWIISLFLIVYFSLYIPIILIGIVEPSIRFLNPGNKLSSAKDIKNLGWKIARRSMILMLAIIICEIFIRFYFIFSY